MRNLGNLNTLYNFQDTIILCKVFETRVIFFKKKFKFNPRKCNAASVFSRCVHRDKSKVIIALPTEAEVIQLLEKTLIVGFSAANTWLAFDTNICSLIKMKEVKDQI